MTDNEVNRDPVSPKPATNAFRSTRAAVRYRDGTMVVMNVLRREQVHLRRAGFRPYALTLDRDSGERIEAELWMQDAPTLADRLNAANLLFDTEPGSLNWPQEPAELDDAD